MRFDRRFAIVLAASLLWALVVSSMFYRLSGGGSGGRVRAASEKPLVIASQALPMGAVIARDSVKLRSVPESLFPAGGFSRIEDVLDRPVVAAILADEPVLEGRLAARGSGFGLGPLIPPGMRAISVRVNDVVGVSGFILPGMRVDVLVTGHAPASNDTITRTVLQNIAVLSAGQTLQTDPKSQSIVAPVVTLLVTPQEAEALTLANTEGHVQLVLRNSTDHGVAATQGRQWRDLYRSGDSVETAAPTLTPVRSTRRQIVQPPAPPSVVIPAPAPLPIPPPAPVPPPVVDRMVLIHGRVSTVVEFSKEGLVK